MQRIAEERARQVCAACDAPSRGGGYPGLCARCEAVILAADALLEGGYARENMIVATLVFAAYATEDSRIEELKNSLAFLDQNSDKAKCLRNRLSSILAPVGVWTIAGDVPIVRRDPMRVSYGRAPEEARFVDGVTDHEQRIAKVGRVSIEIFEVSVKREEVVAEYREALKMFGLEEGSSEEGSIGWQAVAGVIHMTVHPCWTDPSGRMITRHIENGLEYRRLLFPAAELVGEMYSVLRGSRGNGSFPGIGFELAGRRTRQPDAKTTVPACAAWFLAGEESSPEYATKVRVCDTLNKQLLRPHGLAEVHAGTGPFNQLWRDVRKHASALDGSKRDMQKRMSRSEFIDGYFSARDISTHPSENQ